MPYYPSEGVIQGRDGNLYGTAAIGGIFKITPAGQLTLLAAFDSATTGYDATMLAQGADGYLRGATRYGGATMEARFSNARRLEPYQPSPN